MALSEDATAWESESIVLLGCVVNVLSQTDQYQPTILVVIFRQLETTLDSFVVAHLWPALRHSVRCVCRMVTVDASFDSTRPYIQSILAGP